jgi:thiol-disulfide isomerase/thioredoxin
MPSRASSSLAIALVLGSALAGCEQSSQDVPDAFRMRRDAALDAPESDAGPPPVCPPPPPFGDEVGDVLADFTVYDCAGTPVQLHSLCETDVVWLWQLAEWCSPCRRFADGVYDEIHDRYETMYGDRFAGLAVITADDELNLPNEAICAELRDTYGIEAPLYFDPTGTFRDIIAPGYANDVHAILTRGMRLAWSMQFGGEFVDRRLRETFESLDSGSAIPDGGAVDLDAGPLEDVTLAIDAPVVAGDAG